MPSAPVSGVHDDLPAASMYAAVRSDWAVVRTAFAAVYNVPVTWVAKSPVTVGVGELPTLPTIVVPASALTMPAPASTAKVPAVCGLGAWALTSDANASKTNKQVTGNFICSSRSFRRVWLGAELFEDASLRSQSGNVCSFLDNFVSIRAISEKWDSYRAEF